MTETLDKKSQIFRQARELRDKGGTKEEIENFLLDNNYKNKDIDQILIILNLKKEKVKFNFQFPPTLTRNAIITFATTLLIVLTILTSKFLMKYFDDIFGKNLDTSIIIQIIILVIEDLLLITLPIPVIIASVVLYRHIFKENKEPLITLRQDIMVVTLFSIIVLVYATFFHPNITLSFRSLLYDIKAKTTEEKLERTDLNLFKSNPMTKNLFDIIVLNDSLNNKIQNLKEELMKFVKKHTPPEKIDSIIANVDISKVKLTANDIKNYEVIWDGYEYSLRSIINIVSGRIWAIDNLKKEINRNKQIIWQMFFTPLALLFLFILGAQLGIISHKTNIIGLIIFLVSFIIPIFYFLTFYGDQLVKKGIISITMNKLGVLIILILCNLGLYFKIKKVIITTAPNMVYTACRHTLFDI
jgi:lipopolysaccharide export LptBFGC system permease protein LptF